MKIQEICSALNSAKSAAEAVQLLRRHRGADGFYRWFQWVFWTKKIAKNMEASSDMDFLRCNHLVIFGAPLVGTLPKAAVIEK